MKSRHACWALALLVLSVACQFLWQQVPAAMQGRAWNASQAILTAFLLLMASVSFAWPVRAVAALAGTWQLLTAGCSIAYLWRPFAGRCTGSLDYPLGMAALAASVGLAWLIYRGGRNA